jgi:hypothetical protein
MPGMSVMIQPSAKPQTISAATLQCSSMATAL